MKNEKTEDKSYFLYDFAKVTGVLPALLFWRPKVHWPFGKERIPDGPFIVVSNHNAFTNPIVLLLTIRKRHLNFMATTELMGVVFTDPERLKEEKDQKDNAKGEQTLFCRMVV